MKDSEYLRLSAWIDAGGGLIPYNDVAHDIMDNSHKNKIHIFNEREPRDLKFHQCYFLLLEFIWEYMPKKFKDMVPKNKFYTFIKHLKGEYKVLFEFKDGSKWIEYDSISFGSMSQGRFENYVREQLPWIYEGIIARYFKDELYNGIIETIEAQFEKFLSKL